MVNKKDDENHDDEQEAKEIREYLKTEQCPLCGGKKLAVILYELIKAPMSKPFERLQREKLILLGGCKVTGEDLFLLGLRKTFRREKGGGGFVKNKKLLYTVNIFIAVLILLNVTAVMLDSVRSIQTQWGRFLYSFEVFSVMVFTLEYFIRLWFAPLQKEYRGPVSGRIRYLFSFYALVDLIAILPFYLPLLIPMDLRFLRIIRLIRIFRILKLGHYSKSHATLREVFNKKKYELLVSVYITLIVLVVSSCLMYLFENQAQPDVFTSIPETMWWCVRTLTTISHGDAFPVTLMGKILTCLIAFMGIGLFALPAGILASGFMEAVREKHRTRCPHCKRMIN